MNNEEKIDLRDLIGEVFIETIGSLNHALLLLAEYEDDPDIRRRVLCARRQIEGAQERRPFGDDEVSREDA